MRRTTLFAAVVPLVATAPRASVGEWVLLPIFLGLSVYVCYVQAKKKRRNTALAIVLGLFLTWAAAIVYLAIPALPDPSVALPGYSAAPPDLESLGHRSVRSGSIGVVVALLSSLVVWGLGRSLTGGEGDLGPGLLALFVFAGGVIAVAYLGVAAIWHGVSGLRKAREAGRPTRARIGIALGALDLCAVVGAVVVAASALVGPTGTGQHAVDVESSRENPIPVGDTVTVGAWTVRVVGVTLNADEVVEGENQFNDKPGPGQQYVLVTLETTHNGNGSSDPWRRLMWAAVSDDGTHYESPLEVVIPENLGDIGRVPSGIKATGNILLEVPTTDARSIVLYLEAYTASWDLEGEFLALPSGE